jgi:tetratricopeptide (TPR) repeat protein
MKRIVFLVLFISFSSISRSQDTETINKLKDSLERVIKQFEEQMKKPQGQSKQQNPFTTPTSKTGNHSVINDNERVPLPAKNGKLLASVPLKTLTQAELVIYISTIQTKLQQQKANSKEIAEANRLLQKYPAASYHNVALLFFTKKQYVSSLYVLCSFVKKNPGNTLALNNLAAILNHVGFPHKSIPVSQHVLANAAQSAMVNNNLGQAYFRLGDMDNAIRFLSAATRIEPFHIEANATQGYINEARGNSTAAAQQYSNSMKGGYNKAAAEGLKRTNPSDDVGNHLRLPPRMKYPEMDDNIPFVCPSFSGGDYLACVTFNSKMHAENEAWTIAQKDYDERAGRDMEANAMSMMRIQQSGGRIAAKIPPLFNKAQMVMAKAYRTYTDDLQRYENEFAKWKSAFDEEWKERLKDMCKGLDPDECCAKETAMYNSKNAAYMSRYLKYCEDVWNNARWHYNTVAYWYPRVASVPLAARDLVLARGILLGTAEKLTSVRVMEYTCSTSIERTDTASKNADFKDINCPVSINIPLGVGDISISCESLSIDMGEGIMGGLEYEFSSGQTTMYIGAGVQAELGVVSFEASATQFISFDSNFNVTDIGNKVSAGASAMEISSTLGLNGASIEGEAVFGVNSGLNVSAEASVLGQSMLAGETQLL